MDMKFSYSYFLPTNSIKQRPKWPHHSHFSQFHRSVVIMVFKSYRVVFGLRVHVPMSMPTQKVVEMHSTAQRCIPIKNFELSKNYSSYKISHFLSLSCCLKHDTWHLNSIIEFQCMYLNFANSGDANPRRQPIYLSDATKFPTNKSKSAQEKGR